MRDRVGASGKLLDARIGSVLENRRLRLEGAIGRLESVNPLAVIKRGYGMTFDAEGRVVKSIDGVSLGDTVSVLVSDGYINARVEGKKSNKDV